MGSRRSGKLFGHLETLFRVGAIGGLSDAQLLERFVAAADEVGEAAFRAIVERHGAMVLRVCRNVLHDPDEAEDGFQVTFLALARKAGSIRKCGSIASWLHGTALRVAKKAKIGARRRLAREWRAAQALALRESQTPGDDREIAAILHEEIARLPAKYREPIVLCYLEGMTHNRAAGELGCPVGTVSGRLARARDLLQTRLTRRGLTLSGGLVCAGLLPGTSTAALPAALVEATVRAAGAKFSTLVQSFTHGVASSMVLNKLRAIALGTVVVGAALEGVAAVRVPSAHETPHAAPSQGQIGRLPDPKITEIRFEGNASIPPEKMAAKLQSKVGQTFDLRRIEADVKSLVETHWFSAVDMYYEESPPKSGNYVLTFKVREVPTLTKVDFRGRKAIPLKEIEDQTGLKIGARADPLRARLGVTLILRLYHEQGYKLASVKLLKGGNIGDTEVLIEIIEGPKARIGRIDFEGNAFASDVQLQTHINTRKPITGLFGEYHRDMLDEARQMLIDYYNEQGFFEANVNPVTEPGKTPGEVNLTFVISEGMRYTVRDVIIEGNTKIKTEVLREGLKLHSGAPFLMAVRDADKKRILSKYTEIGCTAAAVGVEPRFTSRPGVVDLIFRISEGKATPTKRAGH